MAQEQARSNVGAVASGSAQGQEAAAPAAASVMGRDILVTGNIEATVDLMIEGRVVGDVTCATLVLGVESSVVGTIRADRVRISGKVEGALDTTDLAIEATAQVKGDISYSRIRVANGAIVEGSFTHRPAPAEEMPETKLKLVDVQPTTPAAPVVPAKPAKVFE
ncbi:polymer-forming cytoskeletal protein [Sphingomonas sp.]|jgi:cytoskeletal protein CcmA (bactofilin family)|uniref:bactofilin family protein n=1 Tax=Sphingomonas sp. TaxID=28214 RepID=UPI002D808625|nr:polymer-forming cytoskeletal protein [Sphingomonas sp.]HEU0042975.1 polymer-forming cytoskeletal protein [Sphingomonas sp.]